MVEVRFERVTALPSTPTPNTLYYVKPTGSDVVFQYASGSSGPALPVVSPDTAGPLLALIYSLVARIEALENGNTQPAPGMGVSLIWSTMQ